ncbi:MULTISPECIES: ATP-grasp domain-containing protein [unclassified Caballeronia]|uniref:ATP-grasp domain-containing protein n=1 Tax=unclassified Caballeronia TaxID=2646786 RepID=UPI00285762E5|nr:MULTISPECIES: ATP-grasp domain-containing protein [unclassified Caballeronia]MDR5817449.1 ATP-grasp domain-containing protein [Caballeronia sp. LZ033]MDR5882286.1 ATP-grasp domain-containing protein [Caballeronia sp. LZ032]
MIKIFVFEYLTGGGIDPDAACAASLADLSALIVEGRVMRDALAADLHALPGIAVTVAGSRFESGADAARHVRAQPGEPLTQFVARMAREHDYACIVAPECDGLLLKLHDAVGQARWLGCAKEAIRTASSKSATAAWLAARGMPVTPALEADAAESASGRRWVVKPDDGAGGLDTRVYDDLAAARAEYEARAAAGRNPVLQEWIDGEPLSLSMICRDRLARLVSINRQRIGLSEPASPERREGIVQFDGVDVDRIDRHGPQGRALERLALRVAEALPGLRGFVGIDVVWHPERGPVVIEVNPRPTVAYAELSRRGGRNLAAELLAAHRVPGFDGEAHALRAVGAAS